MKKIRILGIDPALANVGMCIGEVDLATAAWSVVDVRLLQTTGAGKAKEVRKNSDDLRRVRELHEGIHGYIKQWAPTLAVGEVPFGAQDARAAFSFGVATALLAGLPMPLIEVLPGEVQKTTLGYRGKDKEAIIAWATEKWPDLPWKRRMFKGVNRLTNDNEHMADACAILHTGLKTQQFLQSLQMMRAAYPLAA